MKRLQWITLGMAVILVTGLYAGTQATFFGTSKPKKPDALPAPTGAAHDHRFGTDSVLYYAKKDLPQSAVARLTALENSVVRGNVADQKLHLMHRLARYWSDSARAFTRLAFYPYAFYSGEAARLENSEKSLSFAAHLFLNALGDEEAPQLRHWEAEQARELFERTLKLNPGNDSAKVGLGATLLYGGLDAPMKAIGLIRDVADKNPTNAFAQQTLGEASLMSGQLDKAAERFKAVVGLQPRDLRAALLLADTYERMNRKEEAAAAYQKALPLVTLPEMKKEVEKRIAQLKTK